jgi:hypothetical protein
MVRGLDAHSRILPIFFPHRVLSMAASSSTAQEIILVFRRA